MINKDEKNLGKLFLSILNSRITIDECIEKSKLSADEVSKTISAPIFQKYFKKENDDELFISCKTDWISKTIAEHISINKSEMEIINKTVQKKFITHVTKYWKDGGKIRRDFEVRSLSEWVISEFVFLSGFEVWFREKENKDKTDLSNLLSKATGDNFQATGKIEFDNERLKLVNMIPTQVLRKIMNINPAGKIAYRSLDMAIMKGMSEGNSEIAERMKKTTNKIKPWWKFW